ncbi:hypothetical protein, partial [Isoptericola sp. NPDC057559]|uniref:hypothetical protein n=1 Tax=Isoptericola sp. NPDC057559 TaxID=3346168 RepID=UPI00368B0E34
TYYGIDLVALALWRRYARLPLLRAGGAELEAALWRDTAAHYHAGLRNLAGPYDRSYGMDLRRYASGIGLWVWAAAGHDAAPFPATDRPFPHAWDLALGPLVAVLGAEVPDDARAHLDGFRGERQVEQVVARDPRRVATSWVGDRLLVGAEDVGGERGHLGDQFHPATLHWRVDGTATGDDAGPDVGWARLVSDLAVDARADGPALRLSCARHDGGDLALAFQVRAPGATADAFAADGWRVPGLDAVVTGAELAAVEPDRAADDTWWLRYVVRDVAADRPVRVRLDLATPDAPPVAPGTAVVPDWAAVRRRVDDASWARAVLDAVRADHDHWRDRLAVPPPGADSAWSHHYFCGDDGAPLLFDPASPGRHACTACGREYAGEPWDGAWRTRMHGMAAAQAQRAALLARLSDDPAEARAAAAGLDRILVGYARDYGSYAPHGANVGTGRVQPQNLDEAVWAIGLLRAARWAGDALSPEASAAATRLAGEVAALLRPQLGMIHNIHCWLLAALAECAVRTGDAALLAACRDGEFGAEAQVREGFGPEGLWFEVNPHYHYYTVTALLSYVEAAGPAGLSDEAAARLSRAVSAPARLAYDDGRVPAYADGWPDCFVGTFAEQAEAAAALLPGHPVALAPFYAHPRTAPVQLWFANQHTHGPSAPLTGRGSVAALVHGPDDVAAVPASAPGSFVWPHAGIGVLRSPDVRLALRFGPPSGWHDHHDKLAVDVGTAGGWSSLDLGTSGYGAEITDWMRSPVAHDLVILDGLRQPDLAGALVEADDRRLVAEASWGPGTVRRALALEPGGWSDVATVTAAAGTVVEWVFHGDGTVLADGARPAGLVAVPAGDAADDLGHRWLRDVRRVPAAPVDGEGDGDGAVRLRWDAPGSPTLTLPVPAGGTVETAVADANPTGLPLGVVRVRAVVPAGGVLEVAASFTLDARAPRA